MFITFEGGEGTGKSTQIEILNNWLISKNISTVLTREPGGTPIAEEIRSIFNNLPTETMDAVTELLLVYAARRQHVENLIKPALIANKFVLSDRFHDSSWVYQGYVRGIDKKYLIEMDKLVCAQVVPDLTFLFDCDVKVALDRVCDRKKAKSRIDQESTRFHDQVREGFLKRAKENSERFVVVNTTEASEVDISKIVIKGVKERISFDNRP